MSIENVTDRFVAMAGIDSEELPKWSALISYACDFVQSRCVTDDPDRDQTRRLEMLCAVYALKLFGMCGDNDLTQFVAGDVRLALSADRHKQAQCLWEELALQNADLVRVGGFLFGRVI